MKSIEEIALKVKKILHKYVDNSLLKLDLSCKRVPPPWVSFAVFLNDRSEIHISIYACYGPFGDNVRATDFKYFSHTYIEEKDIINQLMNTLTFQFSPYYWDKNKFKKGLEVM